MKLIARVLLILLICSLLVECKFASSEHIYISSNGNVREVYLNKKGELIEAPRSPGNECVGYKKPYHITQYN